MSDVVRPRVAPLAVLQGQVRIGLASASDLQRLSNSSHREEEALNVLAYYHGNGDRSVNA